MSKINVIYTEKTTSSVDYLAGTQDLHYEMEIVATTRKEGDDLIEVKKKLMIDYLKSHHYENSNQNLTLDYMENSNQKRDKVVSLVKEFLQQEADVIALAYSDCKLDNFVFDLVEAGKQKEIADMFYQEIFKHKEVEDL